MDARAQLLVLIPTLYEAPGSTDRWQALLVALRCARWHGGQFYLT
jgi:hypothetical protein